MQTWQVGIAIYHFTRLTPMVESFQHFFPHAHVTALWNTLHVPSAITSVIALSELRIFIPYIEAMLCAAEIY